MLTITSFVFSPLSENTYVLHNGSGDCIIIDPGCYSEPERRELTDYISRKRLVPKFLLNTHCHLDHVFGNKYLHETYGLEPYLDAAEKPVLELAALAGTRWNLPFDNYTGPLHFLREGDHIRLGEDRLNVLSVPGHSRGHIAFYCPEQGFLISGDVLFRDSIGRTDLPGADYNTLIQSIRSRLLVLPGETVVYPGHGEPTSIDREKKHNPFLQGI
jgi:hydroxyacylglutathione hydrolase